MSFAEALSNTYQFPDVVQNTKERLDRIRGLLVFAQAQVLESVTASRAQEAEENNLFVPLPQWIREIPEQHQLLLRARYENGWTQAYSVREGVSPVIQLDFIDRVVHFYPLPDEERSVFSERIQTAVLEHVSAQSSGLHRAVIDNLKAQTEGVCNGLECDFISI